MSKFTLVSGNQFKIQQWLKVIPDLSVTNKDLPEIQGTPKEIIVQKSIDAYNQLNCPVIVEDVCLFLHRFSNFPGPYIKWLQKDLNTILLDVPERADFVHTVATYNGNTYTFNSEIETVLIEKETTTNSFSGFEHQIRPMSSNKTFKELSETDWDVYSTVSPRIRNIQFIKPIIK